MRGALTVFVLMVSASRVAHGEPEFPDAIQKAADIPCAPPCTLCHTTSPGTLATATKPFAHTILATGKLKPTEAASLTDVVAALRANKTDTDGDGISDVAELAEGSDPSDPHNDTSLCGPLYGCAGGHVAKVPPRNGDRAPWLLALALALTLLSRMRRPRGAASR